MQTLALFCGGFSSEFDISIKSADTIRANFPDEYTVFKIIVNRNKWQAEWEGNLYDINLNDCSFETAEKKIIPDLALIYIHGEPGENGKIQAYLDMLSIPYLNSGVLASSLSFDKWYCNQFLKQFQVNVAESLFLNQVENIQHQAIIDQLGLPLFIKPSDSGSSFGISKAKNLEELKTAILKAFQEGKTIVIESFLDGTEVTCGVYRNTKEIVALPLTEIASENEFFDYDAKYLGKSQEITPARISKELSQKVQEVACKIYDLLQLKSIARIDFMIVDSQPFVIEVNTTPGFSPASIVPQMISVQGISIKEFWKEILEEYQSK